MQSIPVAAGIVWRQGRFLAAKRPPGKRGAGYWEFPGGKREMGETMQEALCRELKEEVGIDILPDDVHPWKTLTHDAFGQRVELHFLHVTAFAGEPFPREGQEIKWTSPENALGLGFLPVDLAILEELSRNPPPFALSGNRD